MRAFWLAMAAAGVLTACGDSGGTGKDNPFQADEEETTTTPVSPLAAAITTATNTATTPSTGPRDSIDEVPAEIDSDGDGISDDEESVTDEGEPLDLEDLLLNLESLTLSADKNSLTAKIGGIEGEFDGVLNYTRNTQIEAEVNQFIDDGFPGYIAFSLQQNEVNRLFTAIGNRSPDGSVQAFNVTGNGQFGEVVPGGIYARLAGGFDRPSDETIAANGGGDFTYIGRYVGVTSLSTVDGVNLQPNNGGFDSDTLARENARMQGDVIFNANFDDNEVNGLIFNRVLISPELTPAQSADPNYVESGYRDLRLSIAQINNNGEFLGVINDTELPNDPGVGTYAGIFGGGDARSVAGITELEQTSADGNRTNDEGEIVGRTYEEWGTFVLIQCGRTGASTECPSP